MRGDDGARRDIAHAAGKAHGGRLAIRQVQRAGDQNAHDKTADGEDQNKEGDFQAHRVHVQHVLAHGGGVGRDDAHHHKFAGGRERGGELLVSPAARKFVDYDAKDGGDGNHKGHVLHHARNIDCDGGTQQELERERNRHGRYNRGRQDDGECERAVAAEHADPHKGSDCHGYAVLDHDAADKVGVGAKEQ